MNQFTNQNTKLHSSQSQSSTKNNDSKLLWAFAIDATRPLKTTKSRTKRAARPKYKLHQYTVTSCSPRLRQAGVRAGMRYDEAKALAPDMRIFVYNR